MGALSCYKVAIWVSYKGWINIPNCGAFRAAICITKVLDSLCKVVLANLFLLINFTCFIVGRALASMKELQISSFLWNWIFILLKVRKSIFRITFALMSANNKVLWKNQTLTSLFSTCKLGKTILNVWKLEPSIFWAPTSIWWALRSSFDAYACVMASTLLPELIKALTSAVFF